MIIEKIVIKSFGLLTDMTLEFSKTVNVIEGRNESGKSTIAAFIKYMLYGFDNTEPDDAPSERRKRINWDTGIASGSMYVNVKGKRYLITRTTTPTDNGGRITYKEDSSIVDLETGSPAFGRMTAGEVFFGVEREMFENTAFIGQVSDSGINERTVKESIENILFSGNERINTQRAVNRVNDRMEALLHKGSSGGAIYELIKKCDDYKERIEKSNEDNQKILAKEAELYEIREAREKAILDREHFREIDSCYNNLMVIQTFDRLHELEVESETAQEAYSEYLAGNTKDGFYPDDEYLTGLAVARELVNADYQRLIEAKEALDEKKNASGITRETEGLIEKCDSLGGEDRLRAKAKGGFFGAIRWLVFGILGLLCAVAAVVVFFAGANGVLPDPLRIAAIALGGVAFVFSVAAAIVAAKRRGVLVSLCRAFGMQSYRDFKGKIDHIAEARATRDTMICALEAAENAVVAAKNGYDASKARLTDIVNKWADEAPSDELNEFLDRLEGRVREFLARKGELLTEKNTLDFTVKDIRRSLADKSEIDIRAQVSPLKRKALSGINHNEILEGIEENKAKIVEYDAASQIIERELGMLKGSAGDLGEYHAKLQCLEERTEELKQRHRAYYIAQDALSQAMEKLRTEISPRLAEYSASMMERMTGGKYSSIDVDDGFKVTFAAPDGEQRSVDFLSGGTRDLTYVALRCALIDMLYKEKPPITFDESFAHQDNVRAEAMVKAIKQLSAEECQSFIFTCRNRESALVKEIIPDAGIFKLSLVEND